MNLQKLSKTFLILLCISLSLPAFSTDKIPEKELIGVPVNNPDNAIEPILKRLQEIKEMNKENLSRAEKRELRQEVKQMKKELKANNNGIYLSVGAIIIIILLLILLL
ncbi:MAG: hypothetical protein ABIN97_12910 [Ginsengibacter sp.]